MARRAAVGTDRRFRRAGAAADHGPPERWRHSGRVVVLTERAGVVAVRATEEHVLDALALRRCITEAQRDAGLRFRADYHAAGLEARVTGSYNPARTSFSPFGAWDERTDAEEAAYQRWRKALGALGAAHDGVTMVACFGQMPPSGFVPALKIALAALARHYGLRETDAVTR